MFEIRRNIIGGRWCPAEAASENRNPANPEDLVGHFARSGAEDVAVAVEAAHAALPGRAGSSPRLRADVPRRAGDLLLQRNDEIGLFLAQEEGKTLCTRSLKHAAAFRRQSKAGMAMINLTTAGVDYHVPFGGRGGGRTQGRMAMDFYTSVKTAYLLPA